MISGIVIVTAFVLIHTGNNQTQGYYNLKQRAQFHCIDAVLEVFTNELNRHPPSDANDPTGQPYCGAMKLCEAALGQDCLGFHKDSVFRRDGCDPNGKQLYNPSSTDPAYESNLKNRKGPYLPLDNADVYTLADIYGPDVGRCSPESRVLCDVYRREFPNGIKTGMPILYYRADPNGTLHDPNDPDNPANIYDYRDNQELLELGVPGEPQKKHPLADPKVFYEITRSEKVTTQSMPRRPDTYILISAGKDGLYGTDDDITNFNRD